MGDELAAECLAEMDAHPRNRLGILTTYIRRAVNRQRALDAPYTRDTGDLTVNERDGCSGLCATHGSWDCARDGHCGGFHGARRECCICDETRDSNERVTHKQCGLCSRILPVEAFIGSICEMCDEKTFESNERDGGE